MSHSFILPLWLTPFADEEKVHRASKHKQKYGGPTPSDLNIELVKGVSQTSHEGCVFFDSVRNNCFAGLITKNLEVHNACFNSGGVWKKM